MSNPVEMYRNKNGLTKDGKEYRYTKQSHVQKNIIYEYSVVPNVAKMLTMKVLLLFMIAFSGLHFVKCSQILVENGVYSRVTVQIEPQPQPSNCVDFLDKLEAILNETSHGLHLLSKQQAYIKSFQVVLPKSWSVPACQPGRKVTSRQTPLSHPDISISTKSTFYGGMVGEEQTPSSQPWTEQHAGCGQQGLGIHLPSKFLDFKVADEATTTSGRRRYYKDTWELRRKGQSLLREWCKYRYGTFPEDGRNGDRLYPDTYMEGNKTLESQGCIQRAPLCPLAKPYNRDAPTKQNLLCNSESAIETMFNHHDFHSSWKAIYEAVPSTLNNNITTTPISTNGFTRNQRGINEHGSINNVTPPTTFLPTRPTFVASTLYRATSPTPSTLTFTTTTNLFTTSSIIFQTLAKEASDPKFEYIVPRSSRYVLLLDRTAIMGVNGRWRNIKRAFFRFINNLPVGSELSIITFDGLGAIVNLPPTVVTNINREGLHGRIPRKVEIPINIRRKNKQQRGSQKMFAAVENEIACTFCALNASLSNALTNYLGETATGTIILVTGSSKKPTHLSEVLKTIQKTPIQVYPILYPGTAHPDLMKLAALGGGKAYAVPEGEENLVSPLTYMTEILLDIIKESETSVKIQKVHETRHMSYEFAGTFTMEEDILHKMSVTLSLDDEEKVEFFEITNPSGKKHLFSKFEDGMVVFKHPGLAEAGIWTYHAKLYPNSGLPSDENGGRITVDVVSQSNNAEAEPILLEVFTNVDQNEEVDAYNDKNPVIVYARVTKGGHLPVIDAHVKATVFKPGGDLEASSPLTFVLRDNGAGYPDVTAGDGIYSAYFADYATVPGLYTIRVVADNNDGLARTPKVQAAFTVASDTNDINSNKNETPDMLDCCGSQVGFKETIPASPFHRQTVGPAFYVRQGMSARADVSPPSRIIDFKMTGTIDDSLYIRLEWSAPGDDYDRGRASKYEIRCYTSRDALTGNAFEEVGILVHSSFTPAPLEYGSRQTCTVGVPWPNEVFYYAILAIDDSGNKSPISNVISVYIHEALSTTTTTTFNPIVGQRRFNTTGLSFPNSSNPAILSSSNDGENDKHTKVYIATGIVCGLLMISIMIIVLILVRVRIKRAHYDTDACDSYRAYEPSSNFGNKNSNETLVLPSNGRPLNKTSRNNITGETNTTKNLSNWLDSLPRSRSSSFINNNLNGTLPNGSNVGEGCSPNTTSTSSHDFGDVGVNGTLRRNHTLTSHGNHTLTKTNPYRHKVLTNGSFLNLNMKEASGITIGSPVGHTNGGANLTVTVAHSGVSDDGSNSSRPTTSTEDNHSDASSGGIPNEHPNPSVGTNLYSKLPPVSPVNTAAVVSLKRSNTSSFPIMKSFSERYNGSNTNEPVVLPPPDHFGDHNGASNNQGNRNNGRYPIDTSTARAIIDTYSGNLFCRSTNYFSFREAQLKQQFDKYLQKEQNHQNLPNNNRPVDISDNVTDEDSLEVYRNGSNGTYGGHNMVKIMGDSPIIPTMHKTNMIPNTYDVYEEDLNYRNYNSNGNHQAHNSSYSAASLSKKTRTESVV